MAYGGHCFSGSIGINPWKIFASHMQIDSQTIYKIISDVTIGIQDKIDEAVNDVCSQNNGAEKFFEGLRAMVLDEAQKLQTRIEALGGRAGGPDGAPGMN